MLRQMLVCYESILAGESRVFCSKPLARRGLTGLRKNYLPRHSRTSAAKAAFENKPVIAAVNRCATQKREQNHRLRLKICRVFLFPCRTATAVGAARQGSQGECLDILLGVSDV
jgi:hypothetical protein